MRSAVQGSRLQIEVEDDGVGIRPEALPGVFGRGIGVSNVNERLRVIFGHECDMVIEHRPGGGTRVRMQIPELRDPAAAAERAQAAAPAAVPVPSGILQGKRIANLDRTLVPRQRAGQGTAGWPRR